MARSVTSVDASPAAGFDFQDTEHGVVAPAFQCRDRVEQDGARHVRFDAHAGEVGTHGRKIGERLAKMLELRAGDVRGCLGRRGLHGPH
jgi:hypothetical protein